MVQCDSFASFFFLEREMNGVGEVTLDSFFFCLFTYNVFLIGAFLHTGKI